MLLNRVSTLQFAKLHAEALIAKQMALIERLAVAGETLDIALEMLVVVKRALEINQTHLEWISKADKIGECKCVLHARPLAQPELKL